MKSLICITYPICGTSNDTYLISKYDDFASSSRYLRSRVGPKHSTVTYGSHVSLHLALGLLFLGGGHLTLSTRPEAVAAMICAFYPKFPTHSNDNRSVGQGALHASCRRFRIPP